MKIIILLALLGGMLLLGVHTAEADTCYNSVSELPASCSGSITSDIRSGSCRTLECSASNGYVKAQACEKTDTSGKYFEIYRQAVTGTQPQVCLGNDCLKSGWGYERGENFPVCTGTTPACTPSNNGVEICDGKDNNCNGQVDENNVCGGDPGATSSLRLVSGTVNGQDVSPSDRTIILSPGEAISGSVTLDVTDTWSSTVSRPLISTPTWGNHQTSYRWYGNATDRTVAVSATAPNEAGTYHIIFAYRGEIDGGDVASMTNWARPEVWNDGNDVAQWSTQMIDTANSNGRVQAQVLFNDGYRAQQVPATAITVIVQPVHDGSTSQLNITGGSLSGDNVADRRIVVQPGQQINGNVDLSYYSSWGSNAVIVLGSTPTWGDRTTSHVQHGYLSTPGTGTRSVSVNTVAPSAPGTYYYIFGFSGEFNSAQVMSMSNWGAGEIVWHDGNDIAGWSQAQINAARQNGRAPASLYYGPGNYRDFVIPSNAIEVVVGTPPAVCGNTFIESGETCDDGNTNNGDGCSATCQTESTGACYNSVGELPVTCNTGSKTSDTMSGTCRTASCTASSGSVTAQACEKTNSQGRYFEIYRQSGTGTAPEICFGNDCLKSGWGYEAGEQFPVCTGSQPPACTPTTEVCDGKDNDCDALVDENNVCGGGSGGDPGATSSLNLISGSINGQGISPSSRVVTVQPGQSISGTVSVSHNSAWDPSISTPLGYTPSWGGHQASFRHIAEVDGTGTKTASISAVAPSAPGTYYITFAYRAEVDAGDVFSATNWDYSGGEQWNDGNDIASWSSSMISTTNSNGRVQASWLYNQGYLQRYVPATAITIVVENTGSGVVCGNTVIESGETCDDGNTVSGDGCSNTCQVEGSGGSQSVDLRVKEWYPKGRDYIFVCAESGYDATSYSWDFGNGHRQTTSSDNVYHTYAPGSYTVSCTASGGGVSKSDTLQISVS